MDSFESIVGTIFENDGYWVKTCFKVNLSKEEKRKIRRPSSPRWELDIVAFKGRSKEILVIECKSYLDSRGVKFEGLKGGKYKERYKLFNDEKLREVVFNHLKYQLVDSGACPEDTTVKLCLAAGKVASKEDREALSVYFNEKGWVFYSDEWIKTKLIELAKSGYEDEVAIVTTKLLTR